MEIHDASLWDDERPLGRWRVHDVTDEASETHTSSSTRAHTQPLGTQRVHTAAEDTSATSSR
jgi:hypothetical protein